MHILSNEPHVSCGDTEFCIDFGDDRYIYKLEEQPFKPRFDFRRLFDVHPLVNHGQLFVESALARWG
jgi:hypothetical protein